MRVYGYARVSSLDQNEDRQIDAMLSVGVSRKNLYVDRQSGKDFERPKFQELTKKIKEGDLIYILSLDRLGRNYEEIQNQWRVITKDKKVNICVIDMPLLDTRIQMGDELMGTFVADLVLKILSFVAQKEREEILIRQAQGIASAKLRGVRFGRPPIILEGYEDIAEKWRKKEITATEASKLMGISRTTFYKKVRAQC